MYPTLFQFELYSKRLFVGSYETAMIVAAVIAIVGGWRNSVHQGLAGNRSLLCTLVMVASVFIGARFWYLLLHGLFHSGLGLEVFSFKPGRFTLAGGLAAGILAVLLCCRLTKIDSARFSDAIAPSAAVALACARLGCYFNGCCFGLETNGPWGVTFPQASLAHMYQTSRSLAMFFSAPNPVFPTQLFEALAAFVAALIAMQLTRRRYTPGVAFLVAAIWLTAWQSGIQHLRLVFPEQGNLASLQRLSPLVLCVFALFALARLPGRNKGTQEPRQADVSRLQSR